MENQNKSVSFFRFEDLRIYHKSLDYSNWAIEQTKIANELDRKMILKSLIKSALKISFNIAEGSSYPKSDFIGYLQEAKSAVRECFVLSSVALRNGSFSQEQHEESKTILIEMTKMLGAMIISLQRNINRQEPEPKIDFNSSNDINFEY